MAVGLPDEIALEQAFDYYDAVTKEDVSRVDGVKRASEGYVVLCALMRAIKAPKPPLQLCVRT